MMKNLSDSERRVLAKRAANRFNYLVQSNTARIEQSKPAWRKIGLQNATNPLILNDKVLIITLLQIHRGNVNRTQATLSYLANQAQLSINNVVNNQPALQAAIAPPPGTQPPSADEIRLNMQNGFPDLLFTQAIETQAKIQLDENEELKIDQKEANELLAATLVSTPSPTPGALENKKEEHPLIRHELETEAAVEALISLVRRPDLAAEMLAALEKIALGAKTATPTATPTA